MYLLHWDTRRTRHTLINYALSVLHKKQLDTLSKKQQADQLQFLSQGSTAQTENCFIQLCKKCLH